MQRPLILFSEQEEARIEVDMYWAPWQLLRLVVGCLKGWDSSGGKTGGHFLFLSSGVEMDTHLQEGFHVLLRD